MPVGELLKRMDSRELSEWLAYFELKNKSAQQEDSARQAETLKNKAKSDLHHNLRRR